MPRVKAILIGRKPRHLVIEENQTVKQLTATLQDTLGVTNLKIVFKGKQLFEDNQTIHFNDDDVLLVTIAPSHKTTGTEAIEDQDADVTFKLDPSASPLKKWIHRLLADRLKLPNIVLYWLFTIRPIYYLMFVLWVVMSPVAARYDLGPLYILGSIFLIIVINLGVRKEGELSGYSIFNDNVQSLPGQLTADQFENEIRRGM